MSYRRRLDIQFSPLSITIPQLQPQASRPWLLSLSNHQILSATLLGLNSSWPWEKVGSNEGGPILFLAHGIAGTYVLREQIHLSVPPPHPQEAPSVNVNPLASTLTSATAGTKLSLCIVSPHKVSPHMYKINAGSTRSNPGTYTITESEKESRDSHDFASNGLTGLTLTSAPSRKAPAFGGDNHLLIPIGGREGPKRRKPKSSLMKSSSTYISRVMVHEGLNKRLQDHNPEGLFVFGNVNRALSWLDLSSPSSSKVRF